MASRRILRRLLRLANRYDMCRSNGLDKVKGRIFVIGANAPSIGRRGAGKNDPFRTSAGVNIGEEGLASCRCAAR